MDILPAIDLQGGRCVRLRKGDFADVTQYDDDPVRRARTFAEAGARWLHVVDLDGARAGEMKQFDVIAEIAKETKLKLEVGGGIREAATVEKFLNAGVERVVIGSLALEEPLLVRGWVHQFGPERIVLALDVRLNDRGDPEVLTQGWQNASGRMLDDVLEPYLAVGLRTLLCTDVERDGMLTGPNFALYEALRECWPRLDILASGGVSSLADLRTLARDGIVGVVVGKALYEKRFDLAAAINQMEIEGARG